MTVADAINGLPLAGHWKTMIRTGLRAARPGILDRRVCVRIDKEAGKFAVGIEGETPFEMSFEEVESYVADPVAR